MDINNDSPMTNTTKMILGGIASAVLLFFVGMFFLGKNRARKNAMSKIADQIVEKNINPTEQELVNEFKCLDLDTEDAKKILGMVSELRKEKAESEASKADQKAKEDSKAATEPVGAPSSDSSTAQQN